MHIRFTGRWGLVGPPLAVQMPVSRGLNGGRAEVPPAPESCAPHCSRRCLGTYRLRTRTPPATAGLTCGMATDAAGLRRIRRVHRSFREQGAHVPVGHVQRYLLVVQPRQNVAGGIGVRVQYNPVKTVKPVPATTALQQARAGVDLRCAGRIDQDQCRTSALRYRGEGVRHHALDPAAQTAIGVPVAVRGGLYACGQVLAGDRAGLVHDGVDGLAEVVAHLLVVPGLSPVPLLVAEVVLPDVSALGVVVQGFPTASGGGAMHTGSESGKAVAPVHDPRCHRHRQETGGLCMLFRRHGCGVDPKTRGGRHRIQEAHLQALIQDEARKFIPGCVADADRLGAPDIRPYLRWQLRVARAGCRPQVAASG